MHGTYRVDWSESRGKVILESVLWHRSMTLLHQTTQGNWRPVIDRTTDALSRHQVQRHERRAS